MQEISVSIDANIAEMERLFTDFGDMVRRRFKAGTGRYVYLMYLDNMVDREMVEWRIMRPLVKPSRGLDVSASLLDFITNGGLNTADFSEASGMKEMADAVLGGNTVLFIDGCRTGLIVSTKGWPSRGVQSAETEVVVQGSKDAFTESFRVNTVLVRRRINDTRLKLKQMNIGERS
ncbi:MAG: spore germination protein, partial [Defluviitaleaceae bacterium]|nr:spore germination protein [Defluviitaleaceae bacterium]